MRIDDAASPERPPPSLLRLDFRFKIANDLLHGFLDMHAARVAMRHAQPAVTHQVRDQGVHPPHGSNNVPGNAMAIFIEARPIVFEQNFRQTLDGSQRRTQIVGDAVRKAFQRSLTSSNLAVRSATRCSKVTA